jgi:hypothetical protein
VRAAILALLFFLGGAAHADTDRPLPRGSRADGAAFVSGDGFGETITWMAKELARRGWALEKVGPYRARGVDVARFVASDEHLPYLAIHVFRVSGKTWISFVKRSP